MQFILFWFFAITEPISGALEKKVCLCMYVLVKFLFWIAVWPICGKETVLLAFCLLCFDYGAVALSASFFFFPFGVLERKVVGNCIDSWLLPSFLLLMKLICLISDSWHFSCSLLSRVIPFRILTKNKKQKKKKQKKKKTKKNKQTNYSLREFFYHNDRQINQQQEQTTNILHIRKIHKQW